MEKNEQDFVSTFFSSTSENVGGAAGALGAVSEALLDRIKPTLHLAFRAAIHGARRRMSYIRPHLRG